MQITKNSMVTFDYSLRDREGNVLDSTAGYEPLTYIHGYGHLIEGLEKNLEGKTAGDSMKLVIPPEEAYGEYDASLTRKISKKEMQIEEDLEIGMPIQFDSPDGAVLYYITELSGDEVTLNGNHPFAGATLYFDITVKDVREATKEEIENRDQFFGHHDHEECGCGDCCDSCNDECEE